MTYGQAKKDFALFTVYTPMKNKDGELMKNKEGNAKLKEVDLEKENIPDDTEGRICVIARHYVGVMSEPLLCFVTNTATNVD